MSGILPSWGVESGYHRLLMTNRYPVVFEFRNRSGEIDVNVHPTKLESGSPKRNIRRPCILVWRIPWAAII